MKQEQKPGRIQKVRLEFLNLSPLAVSLWYAHSGEVPTTLEVYFLHLFSSYVGAHIWKLDTRYIQVASWRKVSRGVPGARPLTLPPSPSATHPSFNTPAPAGNKETDSPFQNWAWKRKKNTHNLYFWSLMWQKQFLPVLNRKMRNFSPIITKPKQQP